MRKSIITVLGPTDPVYDLTTVAAVNLQLGITGNTADDALMADKIELTSKMIGELCNRTFALLQVSENFRVRWGEPVHALPLRQYPVTQLISVTHAGNDLFPDPAQYELDYEAGLLYLKCWRWCGEVTVEYIGGYDLPDEAPILLSQACIETLRAQRFMSTRDPTIRSTTHGDTSVTFGDAYGRFQGAGTTILPPNANDMITPYKRLFVPD